MSQRMLTLHETMYEHLLEGISLTKGDITHIWHSLHKMTQINIGASDPLPTNEVASLII